MSEQELCDLIESWINLKIPESKELDYKATISIVTNREKIELGKDVSSFANEKGGVLLYGVPEIKTDGVPVPVELSKCGISIPESLAEDNTLRIFYRTVCASGQDHAVRQHKSTNLFGRE